MSHSGESMAGGLSCPEVVALLSDFVDGELAGKERGQIEEHLRCCNACCITTLKYCI